MGLMRRMRPMGIGSLIPAIPCGDAIVTGTAGVTVGIAKIVENFELPAAAGRGIANHAIELGIFGRFAALLLDEVDAQLVERLHALEHVDGAAAKRGHEVEGFKL